MIASPSSHPGTCVPESVGHTFASTELVSNQTPKDQFATKQPKLSTVYIVYIVYIVHQECQGGRFFDLVDDMELYLTSIFITSLTFQDCLSNEEEILSSTDPPRA